MSDASQAFEAATEFAQNNPTRLVESLALLEAAVQLGSGRAYNALATWYLHGVCVGQDPARAKELFERAFELGDANAAREIGVFYEDGSYSVEQNDVIAFEWYKRGAVAGSPDSQYEYARCLGHGIGTEVNTLEAFKYFVLSAISGNSHAQYALGTIYENGEVVPRNLGSARKWYELASEQGHKEAYSALEDLINK